MVQQSQRDERGSKERCGESDEMSGAQKKDSLGSKEGAAKPTR